MPHTAANLQPSTLLAGEHTCIPYTPVSCGTASRSKMGALSSRQTAADNQDCSGGTTRQTQSQSRLLSLPAELRNDTYEYAFTTGPDPDDEPVNLVRASGPSKALLFACGQTHDEARELYETAHQEYWSKTRFFIDGRHQGCAPAEIEALNETDIGKITELEIRGYVPKFSFDDGVWTCIGACCKEMESWHRRMHPHKVVIRKDFPVNMGSSHRTGRRPNRMDWVATVGRLRSDHALDKETAKHLAGWEKLTRWEVIAMMDWYRDICMADAPRKILSD